MQRELNADCNLRDLNIIYNVMTTASRRNGEDRVELPGWGPEDWVKPGSCLAEVCGLEGHVCGRSRLWEPWRNRGESRDCTKILQHVWFFRVTIESRTETLDGHSHHCRSVPRSFSKLSKSTYENGGKRSRRKLTSDTVKLIVDHQEHDIWWDRH